MGSGNSVIGFAFRMDWVHLQSPSCHDGGGQPAWWALLGSLGAQHPSSRICLTFHPRGCSRDGHIPSALVLWPKVLMASQPLPWHSKPRTEGQGSSPSPWPAAQLPVYGNQPGLQVVIPMPGWDRDLACTLGTFATGRWAVFPLVLKCHLLQIDDKWSIFWSCFFHRGFGSL